MEYSYSLDLPNNRSFQRQVELDPSGYVPTDEDMRTNIPGVFAAGDIRERL